MSNTGRCVSTTKQTRRFPPEGKENVLPRRLSSSSMKDPKEEQPKKRLCLTSNERSNQTMATTKRVEYPSKQPSFQIHCDEKNRNETNESKAKSSIEAKGVRVESTSRIPRRTKIPMRVNRGLQETYKNKGTLRKDTERVNKQKNTPILIQDKETEETREDKNTQKISKDNGGVVKPKRSSSVPVPKISRKLINSESKENKNVVTRGVNSESKIPKLRSLQITKKMKDMEAGRTTKRSLLGSFGMEFRSLEKNTGNTVITPMEVPAPIPLPVKVMVRQAKQGSEQNCHKPVVKSVDPFPRELAFNMEYKDDLPRIELEREQRCCLLSKDFLRRNINEQQRRQIVVYLIHLSSHCRYPSYIIYQTVKLFDVVMDRLMVDTFYLQLTALATLWICLKRQENYHKIPSASTMVSLARELYIGREDLLFKYERKVLKAVNFEVTFPDAFSIFAHCVANCKDRVEMCEKMTTFVANCGGYLIDLTLLDETLCRVPASEVAIVVAELALGFADLLGGAPQPRWKFWRILLNLGSTFHGRFQEKDITGLRTVLIKNVLASAKKHSGFDVVYKKYNRSRYARVSDKVVYCATRIET